MTSLKTLLASSAIAILAWVPAHAAEAAAPAEQPAGASAQAGSDETGTIIVTAQKREQLLIDVPQSVTVVGGDRLERLQANNIQDYLKLVPGLQLNQSQPGVGRLILRGVNTGGVASTVAVYVDETPFGSSTGLVNGAITAGDFDTFDVSRIEVLRGPQGTLYGASSLGGVLKFVTNAPDTTKVEGRAKASVEFTKGGDPSYLGAAMVNVPLGDKIAVRASGYYRDYGGFIDSIGTGGSDRQNNINGSKVYGGRVGVLLKPLETVTIRLNAVLQNIDNRAPSAVESDATTLKTLYGRLTRSQFTPEYNKISYRLYNGTIDWDLGAVSIVSSTSYNELTQKFSSDYTTRFSPLIAAIFKVPNELFLGQTTAYDKVTQEVRLQSNGTHLFDYQIGGYYTRETGLIDQGLTAVVPGTLTPASGLPALGGATLKSVYEEFAGFWNGTVHLDRRFDFSLGGRFSHNDQSAGQVLFGALFGNATYPRAASSEDVFTFSVAPKYKFSDHGSVYIRVAKGFRPGGPNVLPPGAPAGTPISYRSDSIISYEAGLKAEAPDRMWSLDVAAFHLDWRDIQLLAQINGVGLNSNGGSATSDGFEFTTTLRPVRGLDLSANGAYTDAKLQSATSPVVGGRQGDRLPFTPKWSLSANADYTTALTSDIRGYVGASWRYLSSQSADYDNAFVTANGRQRVIPAYATADLRIGAQFRERFSVEVYARNINDSRGKTSASGVGFFPNGAIGTGVLRPRTIGITVGAGF